MLNPITIIFLVVVLALCFIVGIAYKIPPSAQYSTQITADTTVDFFTAFDKTETVDSKSNLDALLKQTENYINLNSNDKDSKTLSEIKKEFETLQSATEGAKTTQFTGTAPATYNEIVSYTNKLKTFVEEFEQKKDFETNLIIYKKDFEQLKELSNYFSGAIENKNNANEILKEFYNSIDNFAKIFEIINKVEIWNVAEEEINSLKDTYYNMALAKTQNIYQRMTEINSNATSGNTDDLEEMKSLATNYKLTCESAKYGVIFEFRLVLENHYGGANKIQGYNDVYKEETRVALTKINHFLKDESLYYTQYQSALNFNSASYKVSVFDYTYFMLSIVGFLTILFGIFLAYKFFGLDKKHGKIDILISQNATFNQVFAGQFLAIFYCTSFCIAAFTLINFIWGALMYSFLPEAMIAVFNMDTIYFISPFVFLLLKMLGIQLQVIFFTTITIFIMNLSRKFELNLVISILIFAVATLCNIFLNNIFFYCLLPFIHSDLTSFLGGGTMQSGFLRTSLYTSGNFFISLAYYLVVVISLYTFTKQLFRKN